MKKNARVKPNPKRFKETVCSSPSELLPFLLTHYPALSRNNVKRLLASRQVLINGAAVSQFDFPLSKGDVVSISPSRGKKKAFAERIRILYEDEELLAIDKPHGLLSVSDDREKEKTAYRLAMDYVRQSDARKRIFVVHRLDKETSGVLIFAKNEELKNALQDRWNQIVSKREYLAVCEGLFEKKEGTRTSYLLSTKTRLMYSSHAGKDGKKAVTSYRVIAENGAYSLLRVNISTGRKNQIRVHMKDLSHQVVGDEKYASASDPLNRLGLHAHILEFDHPFVEGKHFKFVSPCPKEFLQFFDLKRLPRT